MCLSIFLTGSVNGQEKADEGFVLVKDDDDIFIYERWITFPKTDPPVRAREVKGEFHVNSTIEEALALLQNDSKIKDWQKHVSEFKVYPHNDTVWHEYSYHDIPWPVSDQDHFLKYVLKEVKPAKEYFITFETVENKKLAPLRDHAARMSLAGSWRFEKITTGKIKATYRIMSMPSSIPRIFTDPVIRNNMMSTIKSYIDLLEK